MCLSSSFFWDIDKNGVEHNGEGAGGGIFEDVNGDFEGVNDDGGVGAFLKIACDVAQKKVGFGVFLQKPVAVVLPHKPLADKIKQAGVEPYELFVTERL